MTIENGLTALEAQTDARSQRRQPPPRHPKRSVKVPPLAAAAETARADNSTDAEAVALSQEVPAQQPTAKSDPTALRPTQVHLDAANQDFLRRCGAAGLLEGSRDVTMSGVIRFALTQLAVSKTPKEVARAMLAGDAALRRPGRRRL